MQLQVQDPHRLAGLLLLIASIPMLLWQAVPPNQLTIPAPAFLAAHSMMEIFAIVVAALVFFTGHGAREALRTVRSAALGYAFLAVALFDILHFLSYMGMPDLVSPNSPHKSILFWLCGRFAAGAGLLAYILIPQAPVMRDTVRRGALAGVLLGVAAIAYVFLTSPQSVPAMYVSGLGPTSLKVLLEWPVFAFYLAIAGLLYRRRKQVTHCDVTSLMLALLLMAASELFFTCIWK